MTSSPQYNFGAISGIDPNALMNNPYLYMAMMSPNVNFKAAQTQSYTDTAQTQTRTQTSDGAIPVNYATAEPDSSNTGMWVTGAIGAAALIACMAKGKGNPVSGAKKIFNTFFKSSSEKAAKTAGKKLETLRVIKKGSSEECFIPGKRETYKGTAAYDHMNSYNIDPRSLTSFKDGVSRLAGGTFKTEAGYTVTFEGDKVVQIMNKSGKDITKTCNKDALAKIKEEIETAKEMNKFWMKNFSEAKVVRELGDEVAHVTYAPKKAPVITELKTLKPYDINDNAVKSWLYEHPEDKVITAKNAFKKFKAPEGMKVGEVKIPVKGIVYHFENGEIVGITKGGKYFAKGKEDCNVILADKEEEITKIYDMIFNRDSLSDTLKIKFGKYLKGINTDLIEASYVKA